MRTLVIGADGFVGRWLVRHLAESGDYVHGAAGPGFVPPLPSADEVTTLDVQDWKSVMRLLADARPELVFYLAAVSDAAARERVAAAVGVGVVGVVNALTAAADLDPAPRFLHVSSSHVYGENDGAPLAETLPVRPTTIYGAAKAASEQALLILGRAAGVEVVVARPFNHAGPGQRSSFLLPDLADRLAAIMRAGRRENFRIGSPATVRDFSDVRDVVRAYRLLALAGAPDEIYNVGSGVGTSIGELSRLLVDVSGSGVAIEEDPSFLGGNEARVLVADVAKIRRLGWKPAISLRETLRDVLDDRLAVAAAG